MKKKQTNIIHSGANWLPGAMALTTIATTQAATVQITLTGNIISTSLPGGSLFADLTGDGIPDITARYSRVFSLGVSVWVNGGRLQAVQADPRVGLFSVADAAIDPFQLGGVGVGYVKATAGIVNSSYLNPIIFSDYRINGGLVTNGWLDVAAVNVRGAFHAVTLSRLIFDDASVVRPAFGSIPGGQTEWDAVPEPGSFALLTLGAAGLIARRRRNQAA